MRPRSAEASDVDNVVANALAAGSLRLPTPTSAHALLQAGRRSLRTGVQELDSMLRGGFPCRSLRWLAACACFHEVTCRCGISRRMRCPC